MIAYFLIFLVIFQQPRPGPPLPKGEHYIAVGWKQVCDKLSLSVAKAEDQHLSFGRHSGHIRNSRTHLHIYLHSFY